MKKLLAKAAWLGAIVLLVVLAESFLDRYVVQATTTTSALYVASGTAAMGTGAITSGTCATVVTVSAIGALTTDTIIVTPNADPTALTGYGVSASGSLYIQAYPTADNVNLKVCNPTSGSVTPSALTVNFLVTR